MEIDLNDGQGKRTRTNVASLVKQLQKNGISPSCIRCANGTVIYLSATGSTSFDPDEQELAALRAERRAR